MAIQESAKVFRDQNQNKTISIKRRVELLKKTQNVLKIMEKKAPLSE